MSSNLSPKNNHTTEAVLSYVTFVRRASDAARRAVLANRGLLANPRYGEEFARIVAKEVRDALR